MKGEKRQIFVPFLQYSQTSNGNHIARKIWNAFPHENKYLNRLRHACRFFIKVVNFPHIFIRVATFSCKIESRSKPDARHDVACLRHWNREWGASPRFCRHSENEEGGKGGLDRPGSAWLCGGCGDVDRPSTLRALGVAAAMMVPGTDGTATLSLSSRRCPP